MQITVLTEEPLSPLDRQILSLLLQEKHGFEHTNLEYLAEKLSITPQSFHRANDDAATTAMVYLKLRELYYAKDPAENKSD